MNSSLEPVPETNNKYLPLNVSTFSISIYLHTHIQETDRIRTNHLISFYKRAQARYGNKWGSKRQSLCLTGVDPKHQLILPSPEIYLFFYNFISFKNTKTLII